MMSSLDLRTLARPHLVALEAATGETATLSVAGGRDAVTVDFVASHQTVASVARVGRPSVSHATATGKVMLAYAPGSAAAAPLESFTSRTVTDARELKREIDDVRSNGWAQAVKERESDLNAIAAPVFGADGALVAILGVQGPAERFGRKKREAALAHLRENARALSVALGYNGHIPL
jgi:IclR family acetate operon transcriptional repressor